MKVLITGSNGFVGSHIVGYLFERGYDVRCLVRKTSNCLWLEDKPIQKVYGDICNMHLLENEIRNVDAIVHSAGILRANNREDYYRINREGTGNLIESVKKFNPSLKKFIYISSQAAMGPSIDGTLKKTGEIENPVSDYGKSKLLGEIETKKLSDKIPYTILRPASVYGPRDKDVFIFFKLVSMGLRPRPLTKRLFQLVFVEDICKAVMNSLDNKLSDNNTYFLADETAYNWEDIGLMIGAIAQKNTVPIPLPDMAFRFVSFFSELASYFTGNAAVLNNQKINEMLQKYWLGDIQKTRKDLGIDFTNLEIGAKITYSWYKKQRWL